MKTGDKKGKNDFTCTTWKGDAKVNTMRFVHSLNTYRKWLSNEGIEWDYMNVYWRRSGDFEKRIFNE